MTSDHCRITVVGERNQVDLAVPAAIPVGEYASRLARMCGQRTSDALPAVWSLAPAAGQAIPLDRSLSDAGVLDGQRLYLRDLAAGEADEPVVAEVAETVADEGRHPGRLTGTGRAVTMAALGLGWLAAAAAYLATRPGHHQAGGGGAALAVAGLALPVVAWLLRRRRTAMPGWLPLLTALSAIPCLSAAAAVLAWGTGDQASVVIAAGLGANVGALAALAAAPGAATVACELLMAVGWATAGALSNAHVGAAQAAAVAAVLASTGYALAPRMAAALAGLPFGQPAAPAVWEPAVVDAMIIRTVRLIALLAGVCAVTLAVSLPVLGAAPGPFPVALAVVLAVGLLARAFDASWAVYAIPAAAAGLTGLFGALVLAGGRLGDASWAGAALVAAGALIAAAGICATLATTMPPGLRQPAGPDRHPWSHLIAFVCDLATLPLTLGVFGVFHQMMMLGRHM
jgi:type VII secretion integral membrane protein EccD